MRQEEHSTPFVRPADLPADRPGDSAGADDHRRPREGEAIKTGPVDGFKLALNYAGRTYTYHTDRQDVRPCPAIEAE
jgi:hypothetical protein